MNCYNERITLHFGSNHELDMDFDEYYNTYKSYYFIMPSNKEDAKRNEPYSQDEQNRLINSMKEHSKKYRFDKLDFQ